MSEFSGSYIEVILSIASTDKHCALSFVPSDLVNARKELTALRAELGQARLERRTAIEALDSTMLEFTKSMFNATETIQSFANERDALRADLARVTQERDAYKAALDMLKQRENYYIISDHGMVSIDPELNIYYTETANQGDFHHPADIAAHALEAQKKGGEE